MWIILRGIVAKARKKMDDLKEALRESVRLEDEKREAQDHEHKWIRGKLPHDELIKTCKFCGRFEKTTIEEWESLGV